METKDTNDKAQGSEAEVNAESNASTQPSEGVIRFEYQMTEETSAQTIKNYEDIEFYRRLLYPTKVIGYDKIEEVGYGNMSKRVNNLEFVITASQTGHIAELLTKHYVHVKSCYPSKMMIEAIGFMAPSSEALTHYSIYEARPDINHVFHCHHQAIWQYMIDNDYPSISEDIEYGTMEMAEAVQELIAKDHTGLFVMKGHHAGFVSYSLDGRGASRSIKKLLKLVGEI